MSYNKSSRSKNESQTRQNNDSNQQDKTRIILDAAIRVFAQKGYYGARVSDIAT